MLKYLVGRRLAWHDLAFLDGPLYESLHFLLPLEPPAMVDSLDLYFCVQLAPQEVSRLIAFLVVSCLAQPSDFV